MKVHKEIPCPNCHRPNNVHALRCAWCNTYPDGSGGHSVPASRSASQPAVQRQVGQYPLAVPQAQRRQQLANAAPLRDILVAILTFSSSAEIWIKPTLPAEIPCFSLDPGGATNEAAGFELAGKVWQGQCPERSFDVVFFGDGEPTAGGGFFSDDAKAALNAANTLKSQGVRIAAIGFEGESMDPEHLRELASSPGLTWMATAGNLESMFRKASVSVSESRDAKNPSLLGFVIDSSGSMNEGSKKPELDRAVNSSLDYLAGLCGSVRR